MSLWLFYVSLLPFFHVSVVVLSPLVISFVAVVCLCDGFATLCDSFVSLWFFDFSTTKTVALVLVP